VLFVVMFSGRCVFDKGYPRVICCEHSADSPWIRAVGSGVVEWMSVTEIFL
jgi:hypothetical protein